MKKRAHKSLTIEEKVEILDQIGKKRYKLLSEEYGIGISTTSNTQYTLPYACGILHTCHLITKKYICIMI